MARKKVQLAWIENQTARKATFRKRRENLIKKVKEISVLAGTDACGIILSPFEGDPPLFYPPSISEIFNRFFSLPEIDQFKRMVSIESYMKDEISKLKETVQKERRNVREVEVSYTMNSIHAHGRPIETLSCDETSELFWYFEELKKKCELRLNSFDNSNVAPPAGPLLQPVAPLMPVVLGSHENLINDPWLAGNYNMMGSNMQPNYDYPNNLNGNVGFGNSSDLPNFYATDFCGMAGPNVHDPPSFESSHHGLVNYSDMAGPSNMNPPYPQPSFESSHHGLVNYSDMTGPSNMNPPYPRPQVGTPQDFFHNNSGY